MQPAKRLEYAPDGADQPSDGDDQGQEAGPGPDPTGQPGERGARPVFSEQECLERLTQLPGLTALRIIRPAEANSIRATLVELLRHHRHAGHGDREQTLDDDTVLNIFDRDPTILDLLSTLLTEDQVELVMRRATRDDE